MLHVFLGTDRKKARDAMNAAIKKLGKDRQRAQITDAHSSADLDAALAGPGLFGEARTIVLDGVFANEELRERVIAALTSMKDSPDAFFLFEEKLDAATKRSIAKYAEAV